MTDTNLLLLEELPPDYRSGLVAVIGKPNVGKSTLVNVYVGQVIAIVSEKPQTTRRRILGIRTTDRYQIIFVDTPGVHRPRHKLGEYMVKTAAQAVPGADVILFVVDVSKMPTEEDQNVANMLRNKARSPIILALNKMDLLPPDKVLPHTNAYRALTDHADWMMISATRGDNRDKLLDMVVEHLPLGPQYYPPDQVTDQTERALAGELIREQALRFLRHEVPHAVEVAVEEWIERRPGLTYIGATVYVEKEYHKRIVIGGDGKMLKQIGKAAREQLERLLGHQVYLELWVKVRKHWRRDEAALRQLGYVLPKD